MQLGCRQLPEVLLQEHSSSKKALAQSPSLSSLLSSTESLAIPQPAPGNTQMLCWLTWPQALSTCTLQPHKAHRTFNWEQHCSTCSPLCQQSWGCMDRKNVTNLQPLLPHSLQLFISILTLILLHVHNSSLPCNPPAPTSNGNREENPEQSLALLCSSSSTRPEDAGAAASKT